MIHLARLLRRHVPMVPALLTVALTLWFIARPAMAATCASPGRDGTASSLGGIVDTYFAGSGSASAGATSVTVGAAGGAATAVAAGDLLLVIQMQDAQISAANSSTYGDGATGSGATSIGGSGVYEFVRATSAVGTGGGTIGVVGSAGAGLLNSYASAAATTTRGQRTFQVIRVPEYVDATLGSSLTASPWDGAKGGVLAIDVAGTLSGGGATVSVAGLGFRGGAAVQARGTSSALYATDYAATSGLGAHSSKGEGTAGTPRYVVAAGALLDNGVEGYPGGSYARGAPGNAGGGGADGNPPANDQNVGGGGGGNAGAGGQGGYAWCSSGSNCSKTGGLGGAATSPGASRLTMGGGGGAGTTNDGTGSPGGGLASSGAAGGGIIVIRAATISGAMSLVANGASGNITVLNDGSGGAGGGGSVLVYARSGTGASLSLAALGGTGGSNSPGSGVVSHGPGGGGGGGYVGVDLAASTVLTGGADGTTNTDPTYGATYGSTPGASGASSSVTAATIVGTSSGGECAPSVIKSFGSAHAATNQPVRLTVSLGNPHASMAMSAVSLTDAYPTGLINASAPSASTTCSGGSVSATAGASGFTLSGAGLNAAGTCTVSVSVVSSATGSLINTIPVGGVAATTTGNWTTHNIYPAGASLTVTPPLTATKTVAAVSDPIDGSVNPKAIPGALLDYTITVSNPMGQAADSNTVVLTDSIPANSKLIVSDIAGSGSGPIIATDGTPSTGLAFGSATLGYSKDGGATYAYAPVAGTGGADTLVTNLRVAPTGGMAAGTHFTIRFRVLMQ